jgi:hypothetical protein
MVPHHHDHLFRYRKAVWRVELPIPLKAAEIILNTINEVDLFVRHQWEKSL